MKRILPTILFLLAVLLSACAAEREDRVLPLPDPDAENAARSLPIVETESEPLPEPSEMAVIPVETEKPEAVIPVETEEPETKTTPETATLPEATEPAEEPGILQLTTEWLFVGSINSEVYHRSDCTQAARIKDENRVGWQTSAEAEADGRKPCGVCCPDEAETAARTMPAETEAPTDTREPGAETGEYALVGSSLSNKYHLPECRYAKKIAPENLVGWKTAEDAQAAGYQPCGSCKPG